MYCTVRAYLPAGMPEMKNFPSASLTAPIPVPLTIMVAPGNVSPVAPSVTVPFIDPVWGYACAAVRKNNKNKKKAFFMSGMFIYK